MNFTSALSKQELENRSRGEIASAESSRAKSNKKRVAVLIPCYNEELTVEQVVGDFKSKLPEAEIFVYDNNSTDKTSEIAKRAGAIVRRENRQGKGFVVQRMFREIDADVYVMIDGDSTYPPNEVLKLINPILNDEADMVVGSRLMTDSASDFKKLNRFGNNVFLWTINYIFKVKLTDILSGYRAFNRNFVKNIPLFGGGFEIETELTIKSLARSYRIVEIPVKLTVRPEGSNSKINIVRDGILIFNMIFSLFRDYKPLTFFGSIGLLLMFFGFLIGGMVVYEFIQTGTVPRLPSAVLAVGLEISGMLSLTIGLVLHTIVRRSLEMEYQLRVIFEEITKKTEEID
jgi:glycosyltransferase involved in cell wall biosynthesis